MTTPHTKPEQDQTAFAVASSGESNNQDSPKFERLGDSIYRRGSTIYARVRINGRLTWRSTETNDPKDARKWITK